MTWARGSAHAALPEPVHTGLWCDLARTVGEGTSQPRFEQPAGRAHRAGHRQPWRPGERHQASSPAWCAMRLPVTAHVGGAGASAAVLGQPLPRTGSSPAIPQRSARTGVVGTFRPPIPRRAPSRTTAANRRSSQADLTTEAGMAEMQRVARPSRCGLSRARRADAAYRKAR